MTLISRLGRRVAYQQARQDLQRDLDRVLASASRAVASGRRIGVATLSSGPWHLAIEILLAHALRIRGARPELLVCDLPQLPICDERTILSQSIEHCAGCVDDKRELLAASGLPWRGLTGFLADGTLTRARSLVDRFGDDQLTDSIHNGWPIGRWIHVSGCHYLRRDERGDEAEQIDTRRRLLVSAMVTLEAVERWLDDSRPDIVVAESGAHFMWRIVLELARARGIPVVCREMGKGGWDHHLYALNADSMSPDLSGAWSMARDQELNEAEDAAVDAYLDALPQRTYAAGRYPDSPVRSVPGPRLAVAFTNVTWDLATAGRDQAFDGVFDWLRETATTMSAHPNAHLIVRAHPAEASPSTRERITDQLARQWPAGIPNLTVLPADDTTSATALALAAGITLAYTSTAGLEAAARGRPVLVCGAPHYRGKGFTIDIASRSAYRELLGEWANGRDIAAPPDAGTLARRYFHLFFHRYTIRMGWTTSELEPPFALTVKSIDELAPGRNAALDEVCDGILSARQIVLPRAARVVQTACAP